MTIKMTVNDKVLAAIFGHTPESKAAIEAEKAERMAEDCKRAKAIADMANEDEWSSAKGHWVPVLYWDMPGAYCQEIGRIAQLFDGELGLYKVTDIDQIQHL